MNVVFHWSKNWQSKRFVTNFGEIYHDLFRNMKNLKAILELVALGETNVLLPPHERGRKLELEKG